MKTKIKNPRTLGAVIQQGRMIKGLSQRELAQELGIGQKWLWEMEQGKPGILTTRLFELLAATDVELYAELDTEAKTQKPV
ncbi:MAG: helix-turn-helix domain-containing protein [Coriobacteriia bacterium]|nr:helix-turn-helix domain-containing protein [Coriobacteriia bacterium]